MVRNHVVGSDSFFFFFFFFLSVWTGKFICFVGLFINQDCTCERDLNSKKTTVPDTERGEIAQLVQLDTN